MESFSELIKARRSMRKFTEEELTQEQVVTLMKAALMAPTSKRSNAWQFIVVDEKDKLKELSYCKEQASQFIADAALAVVVVADPLASDVWIEDASIASIYLQLQAEDMGLGAGARTFYGFRYAFRRVCARGVGYSFTAAGA
jgi:nitroreductase